MAPVGMQPSFGQLTTSYTRGPQAAQKFQNQEFNIMSNMNNAPSGGATQLTADVANDYKGIMQMQGQDNNVSFFENPIKFISNMVLANKLDQA